MCPEKFPSKRVVFLIGCFLLLSRPDAQGLFAQGQTIDSLLSVIESTTSDTVKIHNLFQVTWLYNDVDPSLAIEYAHKGLALSRKIHYDKGVSMSLNGLGTAHRAKGDFDSAMVYQQRRLDLVMQMRDSTGIANTKDNIAIILIHRGDLEKALEYRQESNEIYRRTGDMISLANGYVWIGNIYLEQSDYEKALQHYLDAKRIFENSNDPGLSYALINIAVIYRRLRHYDEALNYLERAKVLFTEQGNLNAVGVSFFRIALIYFDKKDREKYLQALIRAEEIFTQVGNDYFLSLIYGRLVDEYKLTGDYDQALVYLNKILDYGNRSGTTEAVGRAWQGIATVHYAKKDYRSALDYFRQAERLFYGKKKEYVQQIYSDFIRVFSRLNEPDSVEKYVYAYKSLSDSLINEQVVQAIAEIRTKYDSEKKEQEIALLHLENEKKQNRLEMMDQLHQIANLKLQQSSIENENYQQSLQLANAEKENQKHHIELLILNEKLQQQALDHERKIKRLMTLIFIIVFLAVVISSSLVLLGFRIRKKKDEALLKQTATELRSRLMEINMKAINFQLNPHFIFNCVDTVESLLRESRTDESMTCLRRFSGLTRMILESMSKKEIPLDQEIEIIKSYMELEKVRVGTSFSYTIETDPAVNGQATMVPPLILQPFVENSIKHGFVNRERPYMIRIQIGLKSGMLSCQIEDNGIGVSASQNAVHTSGFKKESLGLKLTEDRLKIINQMNRTNSFFTIKDVQHAQESPSGTVVSLVLPYISAA
jgi:tetratricopeptide (TPR) repeat protein